MSKEQKITTDIKVPNKDLEALRINFPHCFDKDGNFQLEKFKNNLTEKEINFSTESYGLDWLGKSYARLLASDPATTLLKADETHNTKPENANSENLLIKGDNLEVLKHLANAYYEQVKMIYIDPPYNTGSDGFTYQDDRKFTVKELQQLIGVDEEKAKRILDFTQQKSNSHSAWLTFMYPRLYIVKQLLKDDGVIFISIDDNEVAQIRLLMDEVFGEENFVGEFIWIRKKKGAFLSKKIRKMTEYILCYQKAENNTVFIGEQAYTDKQQPIVKRTNSLKELVFPENIIQTKLDDGLYGIIITDEPTSVSFKNKFEVKNGVVITELTTEARYVWTQGFLNEEITNGSQIYLSKQFGFNVLRHNQAEKTKTPSTMIDKNVEVGTNEDASSEIAKLFDTEVGEMFDYAKPTTLIKYLSKFITTENDLILDFFAGSGTTGDAVMQLNTEDNGNRKFILVQLPEAIDPKKSKVAYDFVKDELKAEPTIFEITKERLIRASKKINSRLNENITKLKNELPTDETKAEIKNLETLKKQNNFKIFETTPIWEDYDFESTELDNQTKLFDESKLTENDIKALLTTWKTYDGIALTQELEKIELSGYTAYYGNGKLYLMDKGFTTDNLKNLLEKIDSDKKFNPTSIIAFGYHFESKNLRELSENVKSYTNKKKIDIDFITRY
jgi:adenine-specific DNA-methyltransferase